MQECARNSEHISDLITAPRTVRNALRQPEILNENDKKVELIDTAENSHNPHFRSSSFHSFNDNGLHLASPMMRLKSNEQRVQNINDDRELDSRSQCLDSSLTDVCSTRSSINTVISSYHSSEVLSDGTAGKREETTKSPVASDDVFTDVASTCRRLEISSADKSSQTDELLVSPTTTDIQYIIPDRFSVSTQTEQFLNITRETRFVIYQHGSTQTDDDQLLIRATSKDDNSETED